MNTQKNKLKAMNESVAWGCLQNRMGLFLCSVLFVFSMGTSKDANAFCGDCFAVGIKVDGATQAILAKITETSTTITTAIGESTTKIIQAMKGSTESLVGSGEKSGAAERELTQGTINYTAALKAQDTLAKAIENFGPQAQGFKTCELLSRAQEANSAGDGARSDAKLMTAAMGKRNAYTKNAAAAAKDVLDDYNNNYCTKTDAERGRCKEAPKLMQAASIRADVLLTPAANRTYTKEESAAAEKFIINVTNPVPVEMLPVGMEKKPGGERFMIEQMNANAIMSVAQHSLAQIKSALTSPAEGEGNANAAGINASMSVVGIMYEYVKGKFGNPKYNGEVAAMTEIPLLKELNMQMAFNNWIEFQSYEQTERIEMIQATQLALSARERAERQLAMAKGMSGR